MPPSAKWIEGIDPETSVEDAARRSLEPRLTAVVAPAAAWPPIWPSTTSSTSTVFAWPRGEPLPRSNCIAIACRRKQLRWMKKRLRKIRRAAGDARDLDVLADRLEREYGERVAPVVDLIAEERAAVQPAIVRIAERCRNNDRLVRKTAALLQSIHAPKVAAISTPPQQFRDWAAGAARHLVDEVLRCDADRIVRRTSALHQFRIRAKGCVTRSSWSPRPLTANLRKKFYPLVEELQERLGRIQDHVAAAERCRNWADNTRDEVLQETLRELAEAETLRPYGCVRRISRLVDRRACTASAQLA